MALSELNRRRLRNFRRNKRAFWSLILFSVLFVGSLFAELIANDRPIVVSYRGDLYFPVYRFYPETTFGGDFGTEAIYTDPGVQCLIRTGGRPECWDDPEAVEREAARTGAVAGEPVDRGWMLWPPIPYHYRTINNVGTAPSPPSSAHWLGTDDTSRDVLARVIYGFRLSILFTLVVTLCSSVLGIAAGAVQGYFGGRTDLVFQRLLEIWGSTPSLYVIIILFAILGRSFWLLVFISVLFGWPALVGVVRAEFLRARNFEYVRAARALGVSDRKIMFRHILPNAMVATLTMLPFVVTGVISSLAALDYLGYGLPSSAPSLGELALQAKQNLQAPWLGFTAFFTFAIMLSLLVFIFEGIRDAFDPRKTFQ
ncbi:MULTISPECIES: ABC transporter permease [unclassified Paracoccus (in: a-proteobacteria)]|uniref:ABC transporter permease n=1 Tax=unclassified Paracoccus (in: a-proteobacteria) TaxID=2688777 RepID=UPI0012B36666|nr:MULTISPECIES: ABC transporter permease [unclassified Paracoccus (in: a-proteobacteria)]UXU74470.1 ABC transporter permease [Paracoccus sp. SMMA_5]UXU80362.1 ABC transporter permease [Paracoccus sp. SMMA_5_TC]